jgi:hypothetical protein
VPFPLVGQAASDEIFAFEDAFYGGIDMMPIPVAGFVGYRVVHTAEIAFDQLQLAQKLTKPQQKPSEHGMIKVSQTTAEAAIMPYIQGENRDLLTLTPMSLDDYIEFDSVCRVIAAYLESLDMPELGFKYEETKATGRPSRDLASKTLGQGDFRLQRSVFAPYP